MKAASAPETWLMVVLGLVAALELLICIVLGRAALTGHGHDHALVWAAWLLATVFFIVTGSCLGWEWVLLKMRKANPAKSADAAVVVFCVGLLPLLPLLWAWSATS